VNGKALCTTSGRRRKDGCFFQGLPPENEKKSSSERERKESAYQKGKGLILLENLLL